MLLRPRLTAGPDGVVVVAGRDVVRLPWRDIRRCEPGADGLTIICADGRRVVSRFPQQRQAAASTPTEADRAAAYLAQRAAWERKPKGPAPRYGHRPRADRRRSVADRVRVGIIILPDQRWSVAARRWRLAEEYGFDHAWTYDHLGWRDLVDGPWFDAVPTLTAAAARDQHGSGSARWSPRRTSATRCTFAREVTALDDISAGRLMLGIGAGAVGPAFDTEVLGRPELSPPGPRADRYAEFVELLDLLLRGGPASPVARASTTTRSTPAARPGACRAPGALRRGRQRAAVACAWPPGSARAGSPPAATCRRARTAGGGWSPSSVRQLRRRAGRGRP